MRSFGSWKIEDLKKHYVIWWQFGNNPEMPSRKKMSFWAEKPDCAPYQPTAAIRSGHPQNSLTRHPRQIQFHAEVQFEIHVAAQQKQRTSGSIIEPWQTLQICLTRVLCVLEKILKNTGYQFKVWIATSFLEEFFEMILTQLYWIAKSLNSTLLFKVFQ